MIDILKLTQKSGSRYYVIFTIINRLNIEHACVLYVLIKKLVHCKVGYWRWCHMWVNISDQDVCLQNTDNLFLIQSPEHTSTWYIIIITRERHVSEHGE